MNLSFYAQILSTISLKFQLIGVQRMSESGATQFMAMYPHSLLLLTSVTHFHRSNRVKLFGISTSQLVDCCWFGMLFIIVFRWWTCFIYIGSLAHLFVPIVFKKQNQLIMCFWNVHGKVMGSTGVSFSFKFGFHSWFPQFHYSSFESQSLLVLKILWNVVWIFGIWLIWHMRNKFIFDGIHYSHNWAAVSL